MKVLVCGGRDYMDKGQLYLILDGLHLTYGVDLVVEGGQRTRNDEGDIVGGADYWANQWADSRRVRCVTEKADWDKHGKAAGPIRNRRQLFKHLPDKVVAFKGGRGTTDMMRQAVEAGFTVKKI